MTDVFTRRKRSLVMSRIRGSGNLTTEVQLARALKLAHITGWRRHVLLGKSRPDFVFRKQRLVVFVDGCFWHGCIHCQRNLTPSSNVEFWKKKIEGNRARDRKHSSNLRRSGWRVVRIWEHNLKFNPQRSATRLGVLLQFRRT